MNDFSIHGPALRCVTPQEKGGSNTFLHRPLPVVSIHHKFIWDTVEYVGETQDSYCTEPNSASDAGERGNQATSLAEFRSSL